MPHATAACPSRPSNTLLILDCSGALAREMVANLGHLLNVVWVRTAKELIGLLLDGVNGRVHIHGDPPDADLETTVRRATSLMDPGCVPSVSGAF